MENLKIQSFNSAPEWAAYRVDCEVFGGWSTLCFEPTEKMANKVADFMRRADCGEVRVVARDKQEACQN